MAGGLTEKQITELEHYGELQFSFEDTILALQLEEAEKDALATAKKHHRKGQLAGELVIRDKLFKLAEGGNVGAAKELITTIKKGNGQKKLYRQGNPAPCDGWAISTSNTLDGGRIAQYGFAGRSTGKRKAGRGLIVNAARISMG